MYRNKCHTIGPAHRRALTAIIGLCAIVSLLVWAALPGPAMAAGTADSAFTPSVRISVHRGDLDDPVATKRLFDRIEAAALEVCGASPFSFPDVRRAVRQSDCWRQAVATSVSELRDTGLNSDLAQRLDLDGSAGQD